MTCCPECESDVCRCEGKTSTVCERLYYDENCNCSGCNRRKQEEFQQVQEELEKSAKSPMSFEYARKLAECYHQFHLKLIELEKEIDWPVCYDPKQRRDNFLDFLDSIRTQHEDWNWYYRTLCVHVDHLLWTKIPKMSDKF